MPCVPTPKTLVVLGQTSVRSLGLARSLGGNARRNRLTRRRRSARLWSIAVMASVISMAGYGKATSQSLPSDRPALGIPGSNINAGIAAAIADASQRFNIPARWIAAVMRMESAFNAHAMSSVGAIGLMQLMPRTWADLRAHYGLGANPFDVHDNIIAGAAYLRQMQDRFGLLGMLAAYNAGPERYAEYLAGVSPLPATTKAYVVQIANQIGIAGQPEITASSQSIAVDWRHASLFSGPASNRSVAVGAGMNGPDHSASNTKATPFDLSPTDLFAPIDHPDPHP